MCLLVTNNRKVLILVSPSQILKVQSEKATTPGTAALKKGVIHIYYFALDNYIHRTLPSLRVTYQAVVKHLFYMFSSPHT